MDDRSWQGLLQKCSIEDSHTTVGEYDCRELVKVCPHRVENILTGRGSLAGDGEEMSYEAGSDVVCGGLAYRAVYFRKRCVSTTGLGKSIQNPHFAQLSNKMNYP